MIRMWRLSEGGEDNLGLACTNEGLVLGRTPLIERRDRSFVVRDRAEIEILLSRAYRKIYRSRSPDVRPCDRGSRVERERPLPGVHSRGPSAASRSARPIRARRHGGREPPHRVRQCRCA